MIDQVPRQAVCGVARRRRSRLRGSASNIAAFEPYLRGFLSRVEEFCRCHASRAAPADRRAWAVHARSLPCEVHSADPVPLPSRLPCHHAHGSTASSAECKPPSHLPAFRPQGRQLCHHCISSTQLVNLLIAHARPTGFRFERRDILWCLEGCRENAVRALVVRGYPPHLQHKPCSNDSYPCSRGHHTELSVVGALSSLAYLAESPLVVPCVHVTQHITL